MIAALQAMRDALRAEEAEAVPGGGATNGPPSGAERG